MKALMTLLAASAMLASAAQDLSNDPTVEERFRAKYGRYTPAEEARRKAIAEAKHDTNICDKGCCCHDEADRTAAAATENRWANDYVRAKLGRTADSTSLGTVVAGRSVDHNDTAARLHAKLGIGPENVATNTPGPKATTLTATAQPMCDLPCCNR